MRLLEKSSGGLLEVLPICPEKISLQFYSMKAEKVIEDCEFVASLSKLGYRKNGSLIVNVIKAANQLNLHPLELVRTGSSNFIFSYWSKESLQRIWCCMRVIRRSVSIPVQEGTFERGKGRTIDEDFRSKRKVQSSFSREG
jgi:hypothetical protein